MDTNDKNNTQITDTACLSFGKRYLAVGVLVYLLAVFAALNTSGLSDIDRNLFISFSSAFALATGTIALTIFIFTRKSREFRILILSSFTIILIVILAFCRVYFCRLSLQEKSAIFEKNIEIIGIVKSTPVMSSTDKSFAVDIDVLQTSTDDSSKLLDSEHLISMNIAAENKLPQYGDCISFKIDADFFNDKPYSLQKRMFQSKIVFWGYTKEIDFVSPPENSRNAIGKTEQLGMFLRTGILNSTNLLTYGYDEKALLQGLLIGEMSGFSDELYADYTSSGFIHIASVSGMHTSSLFLALCFILGFFHFRKRHIAIVAIPLLILFCAIALFTPSVCRAATMLIVLLSGLIIRRRSDGITSLAFAAALLVTDNPFCLESPSFLMSFGATLGLLVYTTLILYHISFCNYEPPKPNPNFLQRVLSFLTKYYTNSMSLSLAATIGLGYFTMYFFGKLQWGSIIGNLLIFPITAFSFIGGYINCVFYYISENIATLFAHIFLNPVLYLMNCITEFFAAGIFTFKTPYLPVYLFPVYVIFCIILYIWMQKERDYTC